MHTVVRAAENSEHVKVLALSMNLLLCVFHSSMSWRCMQAAGQGRVHRVPAALLPPVRYQALRDCR